MDIYSTLLGESNDSVVNLPDYGVDGNILRSTLYECLRQTYVLHTSKFV